MKTLKIAVIFALCACLLPGTCLADAALDAAFEAGRVTLREFPMAGIVLTEENVELSEETLSNGNPAPSEDFSAWLETVFPFSVSPDGRSALLTDGARVLTWDGEKARELRPSSERGVEDVYGNLATVMRVPYHTLFVNGDRIAWSPDGRYAAAGNVTMAIINIKLFIDPFLIDVTTGEIIQLAAYSDKFFNGDISGAPVGACFSRDGRYVCYMLYGNVGGHRSALVRFDLETDAMETCLSVTDTDYLGELWELRDGSLMTLVDVAADRRKTGGRAGIARYVRTGAGWMRFEQKLSIPYTAGYARRLYYSEASGEALGMIRSVGGSDIFFLSFRPDRGFEGMNRYWCFGEDGRLTSVSAEEAGRGMRTDPRSTELVRESILDAILSPDGRYGLFRTVLQGAWHLRLVRLSDMRAVEVAGIGPEDLQVLPTNRIISRWSDGVLLLALPGGVKAFTLE